MSEGRDDRPRSPYLTSDLVVNASAHSAALW